MCTQVWDAANQAFIRYEASDVGEAHIGHVVENARLQVRSGGAVHAVHMLRTPCAMMGGTPCDTMTHTTNSAARSTVHHTEHVPMCRHQSWPS